MESRLFLIFTIINLALMATHAAVPPELYWKSMLLTTPMPKAIIDILRSRKESGGEKGVSINTGYKWEKPDGVVAKPSFFYYSDFSSSNNHLHYDPNVALFFLEKDLNQGSKLKTQFNKSPNNVAFLPRSVADSIPFSSNKVQDILNKFSVQPGSEEERIINTLKECEAPRVEGEEKQCATSLESMVDFSISQLGKSVEVVSTEVGKETKLQEYTVAPGVKKIADENAVGCHKEDYPYAVFVCHKLKNTGIFVVPLEGADGTRVKAVAECHYDTSRWSPNHMSFQFLKVKPGATVCHFFPEDHVVWVPK